MKAGRFLVLFVAAFVMMVTALLQQALAEGWVLTGLSVAPGFSRMSAWSSGNVQKQLPAFQDKLIKHIAKETKGKKLVFGKLRDVIDINTKSFVVSYDCTWNGKKTLVSLGFTGTNPDEALFVGYLLWDHDAEYRSHSMSPQQLRDDFHKQANVDFGPVEATSAKK